LGLGVRVIEYGKTELVALGRAPCDGSGGRFGRLENGVGRRREVDVDDECPSSGGERWYDPGWVSDV
jgi:hypothetical protein